MSETPMTPGRLAEARALLRTESSIAFYSGRAKESMLLLLAEAEEAARLRADLASRPTWEQALAEAARLVGDFTGNGADASAKLLRRFAARTPRPMDPEVRGLAAEVAQLRARIEELVQQRDDLLVEDALAERDTAAPPQNPVSLRWGLGDVEYVDDDSVTVLLSGPSGEPYVLELDEARAAELWADLTGPDAVGTRKCGHDDYHDGHPWADRPGIWCPGHYTTVDAERAACCDLHQADCCDPEDCGPCCRACPTCPKLARHRAAQGGDL